VNRPLNFLHLTTFYPPWNFGGDGIQVYRLAHALAAKGHHVDVVHCTDSYRLFRPAPSLPGSAEDPNVVRHELRSGFHALSPLAAQQTGRTWFKREKLREVLSLRRYDVIHFHNISLLGPEVLSIAAGSRAVKMYTAHEHWLICPMHVLWKFDREVCKSPDCFRCTVRAHRPPQLWRYTGFLERMSGNVDEFLSPSRFTARMHAERGFPRQLSHLPNFIDPVDSEWRNPAPRPRETPYFLFAGRLERIKGLQTLIAMWHRTRGYDLLVAGTGTYEPELRAMAASNPRIRFLGLVPQAELGVLYFHALACIVPSIAYETFGMTSVEAFARKTPAIVRNLGALPEVIEESGGGCVYESDDELLAQMDRIADSPELRASLGQRGYDAFHRLWCTEAHLHRYFDYLRCAADRRFGAGEWPEP
jgi:glycosyltransferase involved in cell wall biosynthesis